MHDKHDSFVCMWQNPVVILQNFQLWFNWPRHKACVELDCIMMFVQFTTRAWMAGCSKGALINLKDCSLNVGWKLSMKSHRWIVHDVVRLCGGMAEDAGRPKVLLQEYRWTRGRAQECHRVQRRIQLQANVSFLLYSLSLFFHFPC